MADWQAIKTEYITTDTSYRKLADKYGVHYKVVANRGKDEKWGDLRTQHRDKTLTKTLEKISTQEANRATRIFSVADKLLDKIEFLVDNGEAMLTDKAIRSLTAAVRDLKEIQGVKSKLDQQEQEARIANLRKQAEDDEQKEAPSLIVEGLPEEFKV